MPLTRSPSPAQPRNRPPPSPTRAKRASTGQPGSAWPAVKSRRQVLSTIQAESPSVYLDANLAASAAPQQLHAGRSQPLLPFQLPHAPTPTPPSAAIGTEPPRSPRRVGGITTRRSSAEPQNSPFVAGSPARHVRLATDALSSGSVGPFKFVRTLNSGAFGVAYMTLDMGAGRLLCARVVEKKKMLADSSILRGLLLEVLCHKVIASSCAQDRACIMQLHGILHDEKQVLYVMPLMQCDLLAVIRGRCDPRLTRRWVAQMALGIDALHRMGIIHRDIKPENILLDAPDGNVRIADFNAAFASPWNAPLEAGAVYTREVTGSLPYMAWEMTRKKWYGKMVDWWSLGCLMFDLVTGTLLFKNDAARAEYVMWDQTVEGLSYLSWRTSLSEEEESVIAGLINIYPCSRFQLHHLRDHAYFFDEYHVNVFDALLREAPTDVLAVSRAPCAGDLAVEERLKDTPLSHATFRLAEAACRDPSAYDFSTFSWVNPHSPLWSS